MSLEVPSGAARPTYTKNDFVSGAEVRWCPGCGDYSILGTVQQTLARFDIPRENYVFISGIGCSSRLPYYMNTYGFHTVHGRAPTVATGLRLVNPDLSIWVITGDGDGLSIGGNHILHAMRRNFNFNILFINNQIYGLTKGQYSPTSPVGSRTKSSPLGSIDHPVNPLCVAIASEATFVARTLDTDPRHMGMVLERAARHRGISFIEIYQNCIIFNDKAFSPITGRDTREDRMIYLEHGKPLVFGREGKRKAFRLKGLYPEIVDFDPARTGELLIHNEADPRPNHAYLLTQLVYPEFPAPFGVFRCVEKPTYGDLLHGQIQEVIRQKGRGSLEKLLNDGDTWTVK
jgi:2-oxoglutarate ferredoxin oxidoreductase subunit beta